MNSRIDIANNIVHSNTRAISSLENGRQEEAISLLHTALSQLNILMCHSSSTFEGTVPLDNAPIGHRYIPAIENKINVGCIEFFNRAFEVSRVTSSQDQNQLAVVVLFNLALAYHGQGIKNDCSQNLENAMEYYKMALDFMCDSENGVGLENMILLVLALWNNMGHIHSYFFQVAEIRLCVDWIQNLLECRECSILEKNDYVFFFVSLLGNPEEQVAAAPAA